MKRKHFDVVWTREAILSLKEIFDFISLDSRNAAQKVKLALRKKAISLEFFPDRYVVEELLSDKPGNYRFVCKWAYKIIYKFDEDKVLILLVVQSHQSPRNISKRLNQ